MILLCLLQQLINLTQRRRPPPDLFMIKNGFVLTEEEAIERRTKRRIVNRMSRKMFIPPEELSEEEYVEKCKTIINDILLGVSMALLLGILVHLFLHRIFIGEYSLACLTFLQSS